MNIRNLRAPVVAALALLLSTGFVFSQAGRGTARLGGVILDQEGKPVPGVNVILALNDNPNQKFESRTNAKGEWSFAGLGSGMWTLSANTEGFKPIAQSVQISQLNLNPKVTIQLTRLTPSASGGVLIDDETTLEILDLGNKFYKDGQYSQAMTLFEEFKAKNPRAYQIDVNIADCLREKGEYDKAVALYDAVITRTAQDTVMGREVSAKAMAGIGNVYLKQNKIQEARDFFQKSIDASPDDELLAYNVGEIYFSNQSLDEAQKYFELSVKIKPTWPDPYLRLGYVFLNKGDNAKATECFEKFLALEPEGERAALAQNILSAIKK